MKHAGLRDTISLLGLFFLFSLAGFILGLAWRSLNCRYIASSDQPGSTILLFLLPAPPKMLGAAIAGALGNVVFLGRKHLWTFGLAALMAFYSLSNWSFGFHIAQLDAESVVGWVLQAVLIGGSAVATNFALLRWERRRNPAGPPPN